MTLTMLSKVLMEIESEYMNEAPSFINNVREHEVYKLGLKKSFDIILRIRRENEKGGSQ